MVINCHLQYKVHQNTVKVKNYRPHFCFIILSFFTSTILFGAGQEGTPLKSKVDEVTVFLQGAQVVRNASVSLKPGTATYVFKGLSAYLDPTSIQVKGIGNFTVLSVTPKTDFLGETAQTEQSKKIRDTLDQLLDTRAEIQNELGILNQQEQYLQMNRAVKGDQNLNATDFEQITTYFYKQMAGISRKKLEFTRQLEDLQKKIRKYQNQLNAIQGKTLDQSVDVYVEVKAEKAGNAEIRLSYYVMAAGWTPSYDIRVNEINKPFSLVYKASVFQNSGEDWSQVKLTFSNANPNESGNVPELLPYVLRLGRYGGAGEYRKNTNATSALDYMGLEQKEIRGRVIDQLGEPVAYASVTVSGTTLSTFTDENGNFRLSIPGNREVLVATALGYQTATVSANQDYVQMQMVENTQYLVETGLLDKNVAIRSNVGSQAYGYSTLQSVKARRFKSKGSYEDDLAYDAYEIKGVETTVLENQTTIEFVTDGAYSVVSGAKPLTIDMKTIEIPAHYEYRTVPKLETAAFLVAQVTDWSQYQLLEGMANLYFENTFVGSSALNVQFFSDTLDISLGKDKNVIVKRTKVREYSSKQLLGSDMVAKRHFKIEVKNNKSSTINLVVYDQVPISTQKEIVVEVKEIAGAKHNDKTGKLEWKQSMDASSMKIIEFKYQVKYPSGQIINLE